MAKSPKTIRQEKYAKDLQNLYEKYPQAKQVKERYKVMRIILKREWNSLTGLDDKILEDILKDVVHIDRRIRKLTEGEENELKEQLSQEEQIKLGYEPGANLKV